MFSLFTTKNTNNNTTNNTTNETKVIDTNVSWDDTKPFVPPINSGIVIKVYDGDTITIASRLPYSNSDLYRFPVRLNGIDCPEMKSHNEDEKECAKLAQLFLSEQLLQKRVELRNVTTEKYGRLLADVYLDGVCLNQLMIKKRLAVAYNGKTKVSPKNWTDYYYNGII
jgi:micrococcal nuclease